MCHAIGIEQPLLRYVFLVCFVHCPSISCHASTQLGTDLTCNQPKLTNVSVARDHLLLQTRTNSRLNSSHSKMKSFSALLPLVVPILKDIFGIHGSDDVGLAKAAPVTGDLSNTTHEVQEQQVVSEESAEYRKNTDCAFFLTKNSGFDSQAGWQLFAQNSGSCYNLDNTWVDARTANSGLFFVSARCSLTVYDASGCQGSNAAVMIRGTGSKSAIYGTDDLSVSGWNNMIASLQCSC